MHPDAKVYEDAKPYSSRLYKDIEVPADKLTNKPNPFWQTT